MQHGLAVLRQVRLAQAALISSTVAPAKTGVGAVNRASCAAQPEVRLEDLADVHTRRHAERIQDDVHRRPSGMYGMSSSGTICDTTPLLP